MTDNAILVLEDGTIFEGRSIGANGQTVGEVVFNTALTGYQEILSDPSYAKQIVTLTYPHIGNVGANDQDEEAPSVFAAGLIVRDAAKRVSNWRSQESLGDFLKRQNVVGISDIDTRKLTRILREKGAQRGCILAGYEGKADGMAALTLAKNFPGLEGMDLAKVVSTEFEYPWVQGSWDGSRYKSKPLKKYRVAAYDFGIKRNILRLLADRGCEITVVPAASSATQVLGLEPDGIFLSNGPGDPQPCDYAINAIKRLMQSGKPIFGICLGHQLLSLALGAKTQKMKFGHHGANHPVIELSSGRVFITSQNHGFSVDEASLPSSLRVTHRSLFDQTLQGIECMDYPAFSFQGHPEASPGPHDMLELFDKFIAMMKKQMFATKAQLAEQTSAGNS